VASLAVETVVERTNVRSIVERLRDAVPGGGGAGDDPDAGLLDPEYHLSMFRWREEHMLAGVARRLKNGMQRGGDPAAVFSSCQDHVIGSAWAHVERLVLEAFTEKVAAMEEDDPNRDAMNLLCDLFALSAIEKDRAWFLEHGRLSNARAKAVTAMVNELCRRVRPICDHLVDAFDIPPQMLRAEIILSAP
jgi:acyl-CoA oxidase